MNKKTESEMERGLCRGLTEIGEYLKADGRLGLDMCSSGHMLGFKVRVFSFRV